MMQQATVTRADQIVCPSCGTRFSLTDQLLAPLRAEVAVSLRTELEATVRKENDEQWVEIDRSVHRLEAENTELKQHELELRRQWSALQREKDDLELRVARELDLSLGKLRIEEQERARDAYELRLREQEEKIRRLGGDLEAARRRAVQPPSELQGTVQEQALDEALRCAFPDDEVTRVPRGRAGADIIQRVRPREGAATVATIIWESKRTTTFKPAWITTLKKNAASVRADVAVLVSAALPDENQVCERGGVWVVSFRLAQALATILRNAALVSARSKAAAARRDDLAGQVYDYVTSTRLRDLVVDALGRLAREYAALNQETDALTRRHAQRRESLRWQAEQWATLVGELTGLGTELPPFPPLELPPKA